MRTTVELSPRWGRLAVLAVVLVAASGNAADWSVQTSATDPPEAFDTSIRSLLAAPSIQVAQGGQTAYEFWFRKETPLKSQPAAGATALKSLAEATLLGVVRVAKSKRDYRDDELFAGLYTVRFAMQPQDGNHLGTADFPYFAVLTPAKLDTKLDGIGTYRELVKASSRESSTDHPFIMSLRPVSVDEGTYPRVTEPAADHKAVRLKLAGKSVDAQSPILFDLVIEGVAIH